MPTGLFLMLQRLGTVMAMAGFIPACLAKGDKNTAHKHLGDLVIRRETTVQHADGTLALPSLEAAKHGLKLAAAVLVGVFPHSPAATTSSMTYETIKKITSIVITATGKFLLLVVNMTAGADV